MHHSQIRYAELSKFLWEAFVHTRETRAETGTDTTSIPGSFSSTT